MKLNRRSQGETAAGRIINILSNDVQRFEQVTVVLHFMWILPLQIIIVSYFMYTIVGVYCFVGIGSMILITIPLQSTLKLTNHTQNYYLFSAAYFGKVTSYLRLQVAQRCDVRVKHMNEVINGMQVIKMYAWEKPIEKLIVFLRAREIKALIKSSYLRGFYASCSVFVERLTLFLTVVVYSLMGLRISADIVFSLAQFFNILQCK